jgi:hypothetical protein
MRNGNGRVGGRLSPLGLLVSAVLGFRRRFWFRRPLRYWRPADWYLSLAASGLRYIPELLLMELTREDGIRAGDIRRRRFAVVPFVLLTFKVCPYFGRLIFSRGESFSVDVIHTNVIRQSRRLPCCQELWPFLPNEVSAFLYFGGFDIDITRVLSLFRAALDVLLSLFFRIRWLHF